MAAAASAAAISNRGGGSRSGSANPNQQQQLPSRVRTPLPQVLQNAPVRVRGHHHDDMGELDLMRPLPSVAAAGPNTSDSSRGPALPAPYVVAAISSELTATASSSSSSHHHQATHQPSAAAATAAPSPTSPPSSQQRSIVVDPTSPLLSLSSPLKAAPSSAAAGATYSSSSALPPLAASSPSHRQQQQQQQRQREPHEMLPLHEALRRYFQARNQNMLREIEGLVKRHSHAPDKLWALLFKKYGPYPVEGEGSESKAHVRAELLRFFKFYEPSLQSKVDDIIIGFADYHDVMWQSLEARFGPKNDAMEATGSATATSSRKKGSGGGADDEEHLTDLGSRLRRFFAKVDSTKLNKVEEMARAYAKTEDQLFSMLKSLYGKEPERDEHRRAVELAAIVREQAAIAKKLSVSGEVMEKDDAERWLKVFCARYAPEKMDAIGVILARFSGHETQLREAMESVFGSIPNFRNLTSEEKRAIRTAELQRKKEAENAKTAQFQERLRRFFAAYDRSKLGQVETFAHHFAEFETSLMEGLVKRYGNEPAIGAEREAYRKRIQRILARFAPHNLDSVEDLLSRHAAHEEHLIHLLTTKYGPEPPPDNDDDVLPRASLPVGTASTSVLSPSSSSSTTTVSQRNCDPCIPAPAVAVAAVASPSSVEEPPGVQEVRKSLCRFFSYYEPLQIDITVPKLMRVYSGRYQLMWPSLIREYGPHPDDLATQRQSVINNPLASMPNPLPFANEHASFSLERAPPLDAGRAPVSGFYDTACMTEHVKRRLLNFFAVYDPPRMRNIARVWRVFGPDRENEMFDILIRRYGPEPRTISSSSRVAQETSARMLRSLITRYYSAYDPSRMYETDALVEKFIGAEEDAVAFLQQKYGPDPPFVNALAEDLRKRLILYFRYYDPPQLLNVETIAEAYIGMEAQLFAMLAEQYGPELPVSPTDHVRFKMRLVRFIKMYPEAGASLEGSTMDEIVRKHDDFEDEYFVDLVQRFGPEPPDPEVERQAERAKKEEDGKRRSLEKRLSDFFVTYDEDQQVNIATLVDAYWNDPETLMRMLCESYGLNPTDSVPGVSSGNAPAYKPDGSTSSRLKAATAYVEPDLKERITNMYRKYKSGEELRALPQLFERYAGREQELLSALVLRHGPEPKQDDRLSDLSVSTTDSQQREHELAAQPSQRPPAPEATIRQSIRPRERAIRILERCDPSRVGDIDRLLKKFSDHPEGLIEFLEEKYELHPGTLKPISQELRPEDLLGGDELQQSAERAARLQAEQSAEPEPELSYRERVQQMLMYYDPKRIVQMDLELKAHDEREEAYIASLVEQYGPEPRGRSDLPVRYKVLKWYQSCEPKKVAQIDEVMLKFKGREALLLTMFLSKYGPTPPDPVPLPAPEHTQASARRELTAIYSVHAPEKLAKIEELLARYRGCEDRLVDQAQYRYGVNLSPQEQLWRERFTAIYTTYAPERLPHLPELMAKYAGEEMNLMEQLQEKYKFSRIPSVKRQQANDIRDGRAPAPAELSGSGAATASITSPKTEALQLPGAPDGSAAASSSPARGDDVDLNDPDARAV